MTLKQMAFRVSASGNQKLSQKRGFLGKREDLSLIWELNKKKQNVVMYAYNPNIGDTEAGDPWNLLT